MKEIELSDLLGALEDSLNKTTLKPQEKAAFILKLTLIVSVHFDKIRKWIYEVVQNEQDDDIKSLALSLLEGPFTKFVTDYLYLRENIDKDRISSSMLKIYSGDSLDGYADESYDKGGEAISDQQRGLIFPLIKEVLSEQSETKTIVEIGTGNGDIIALLAREYSNHKFIGIDFSVRTAQHKHRNIVNLNFRNGYALDLLDNDEISGDIVFVNSTFVLFTPEELKKYLRLFKQSGFTRIVINEPTWGVYSQKNNSQVISRHMESITWYHNYCGYLREAGYNIRNFQYSKYKHPISERPDIYVLLACGELRL